MANTLVRIFESFPAADSARSELLASGFPMDGVEFTVRENEEGPVQGNFYVGNGREQGGINGSAQDSSYRSNFGDVAQRGVYMVTVEVNDEAEAGRAKEIMDRLGGVDVDAIAAGRQSASRPGQSL